MSINNILLNFAQQDLVLARKATERAKINNSLAQLQKVLKNKLDVSEFLTFGSYTRNTILPRKFDPKSDIDLMVIFNSNYTSNTYRNQLSKALNETYPNSLSAKDYPSVKLELNHIKFDIVPALKERGFMSGMKYYIPDKSNGWQRTNPNDINQKLMNKNQTYGDNIIRQVIRLCKHWNANAGRPFDSYLMEKTIIDLWYWGNENTYERFLKTLNTLAGDRPMSLS